MLKLYLEKTSAISDVNCENLKDCGVVIFGFNGVKKINYKNELNGSESVLPKIASISKKLSNVIIVGAITDNYGIIRKSAVIADKGKLLGISDMNNKISSAEYSGGGGHRVYQTSRGKIGVLIGDDLLDIEAVKAMAICDADFIIAIVSEPEKKEYGFLVRAYAYLFGLPIVVVTQDSFLASDMAGEICGASKNSSLEMVLPLKKTYKLVISKKRGIATP